LTGKNWKKWQGNDRLSCRVGRTKAIATALAKIADAFPEPTPQRRFPARESDQSIWETAIELCAAMDRYKRRGRWIKNFSVSDSLPAPLKAKAAIWLRIGWT
jgi:hypothetical protein